MRCVAESATKETRDTFYRSFFFFDLDSSEVRLRRLLEKNTVLYESVRLGSVPIDGVAYRIPPASSYLEFDNVRTQGLILITLGDRPHSPEVYPEVMGSSSENGEERGEGHVDMTRLRYVSRQVRILHLC